MLTFSIHTCNLVVVVVVVVFFFFFFLNELADKYSTIPNFGLVNEPNLTKIL